MNKTITVLFFCLLKQKIYLTFIITFCILLINSITLKGVERMLAQEIQSLLSEKVLTQIEDKSIQNIIRGIIFNSDNKIDWDDALYRVYKNMPELIKEEV